MVSHLKDVNRSHRRGQAVPTTELSDVRWPARPCASDKCVIENRAIALLLGALPTSFTVPQLVHFGYQLILMYLTPPLMSRLYELGASNA